MSQSVNYMNTLFGLHGLRINTLSIIEKRAAEEIENFIHIPRCDFPEMAVAPIAAENYLSNQPTM